MVRLVLCPREWRPRVCVDERRQRTSLWSVVPRAQFSHLPINNHSTDQLDNMEIDTAPPQRAVGSVTLPYSVGSESPYSLVRVC